MVILVAMASKIVACGGRRKHQKASDPSCRYYYRLAGDCVWVAGMERKQPVVMRVVLGG